MSKVKSELRARMLSLAAIFHNAAIDCDRNESRIQLLELSELRAFCRGQAAGYRAAADEIRRALKEEM